MSHPVYNLHYIQGANSVQSIYWLFIPIHLKILWTEVLKNRHLFIILSYFGVALRQKNSITSASVRSHLLRHTLPARMFTQYFRPRYTNNRQLNMKNLCCLCEQIVHCHFNKKRVLRFSFYYDVSWIMFTFFKQYQLRELLSSVSRYSTCLFCFETLNNSLTFGNSLT